MLFSQFCMPKPWTRTPLAYSVTVLVDVYRDLGARMLPQWKLGTNGKAIIKAVRPVPHHVLRKFNLSVPADIL
jgi:hypothetical protein